MTTRPATGLAIEILKTLILVVVIFLGIQTFVAQPFRVEGASMEATLMPDQYLLIDKLSPHWAPYARGDIVVLQPPPLYEDPGGTPFIKRVVGLPGDVVALHDGNVYVNGREVDEPYVFDVGGVRQPTNATPGGASEWLVPQGSLFVLGDHRQASADSRSFGPVDISRVIGRAWLRYWPLATFGLLPA